LEAHFQTEDYIKESNILYTILRNTDYADSVPILQMCHCKGYLGVSHELPAFRHKRTVQKTARKKRSIFV